MHGWCTVEGRIKWLKSKDVPEVHGLKKLIGSNISNSVTPVHFTLLLTYGYQYADKPGTPGPMAEMRG